MADEQESTVEWVYGELTTMAIAFQLRPSERINEVALAKKLGVSRTPLREALNRLVADGYLDFVPQQGFFRRALDPQEIFDLYEVRKSIEVSGIGLAIQRAKAPDLEAIRDFLDTSSADIPGRTIADLVELDEIFHNRMIALSGNHELVQLLEKISGRIRFVRWIDMENGRRSVTQSEHRAILQAAMDRDEDRAKSLLGEHIDRRLDQIVEAVKEGYARIYIASSVMGRPEKVDIPPVRPGTGERG
ncbi:GntR family transcriptional regulator [Labrys monachus]|uniref:DNA-binding GntR family transcriptional regulator n=1 Tax=Labrys monachus TaxID=217067 RepID=A0ABU0FNB8_9HYPH|nr:GntR family transcriptional regulator [Labrys monachus]MDQ0396113.1 DNA-binding GntR family transcriptional regulator [Labrys monachus]